jgi:hypothetical protein
VIRLLLEEFVRTRFSLLGRHIGLSMDFVRDVYPQKLIWTEYVAKVYFLLLPEVNSNRLMLPRRINSSDAIAMGATQDLNQIPRDKGAPVFSAPFTQHRS